MKQIFTFILFSLSVTMSFAQEKSLKEFALDEFKNEHYDEAINFLENAVKENPNDAEIYYYLGWFNHYRAYDSRPLYGYDYLYSERIFSYLDKAIELHPNYGDAKYFYGAECSANAFVAMQNYDSQKLKYFYELAYKKGAYPDWLIEFGKNVLMSCEENAILFAGGNADFDICSYLQLCEKFRTDVTVIPIGNIDRPWYISFLKKGIEGSIRKINVNLSEQQIMDIHPFKWRTTDITIKISQKDKSYYKLFPEYEMKFTVVADLQSDRMHSKIENETEKNRTYLSPQRAILLQIVEDNFFERPIYFSNFADITMCGGLNDYFQNCGLISKLTPIKTKNSDYEVDINQIEKLLVLQNIDSYKNIKNSDIPRISGIVLYGYGNAILNLATLYKKQNETQKLEKITKLYTQKLKIGYNVEYEEEVMKELKK